MYAFHTLSLRLTAAQELGFAQTGLYFLYQLGKRTGFWQLLTPQRDWSAYSGELSTEPILHLPANDYTTPGIRSSDFLAPADEIVNGRITLFGAVTTPLNISPSGHLSHWTRCEAGSVVPSTKVSEATENLGLDLVNDIKFTWEPARFGWVFPLARAYLLTNDEKYPAAFWHHFEQFCVANPPNTGPNWASAQEVGLRLIALTFAHRVFVRSIHATPERIARLGRAAAAHAARIPPTLLYARAQNNNHLLSEAAALYTAGLTLPDHPQALRWRNLGWKWFHHGLQTQIEPGGTYAQHSTNYHRLMLQLALWMHTLAQSEKQPFPDSSLKRLAAATHWLLALCDPDTGRVPNLGPNDGSYIFPLTSLPYYDYRPVLQAASHVFLGHPAFPTGEWDEMNLWLGDSNTSVRNQDSSTRLHSPLSTLNSPPLPSEHPILKTADSRAILRAAHFKHRPGHADQLHLNLWWRGLNVALDPGTYLYNGDPPWDNALMSAFVHNTVTVNGLDQMTRAGRFLYVHRAQATVLEHTSTHMIAEHIGYRRQGVIHRRTVDAIPNGWRVSDQIIPHSKFKIRNSNFAIRLHWLLPDWPWKFSSDTLQIEAPFGWITLSLPASHLPLATCHLFRAGQSLFGSLSSHPTWGWYSPTYGVKWPALAFVVEGEGALPIKIISSWQFPE